MATDAGYGSPSTVIDAGYGSPSTVVDRGYGEPSGFAGLLPAVVTPLGGAVTDDGGTRVVLTGGWMAGETYRVRLVDAGGDLHPNVGFCYSGTPGRGSVCAIRAAGTEVHFIAPAVPPGVYSVRVYAGPTSGESVDAVNTLSVRRRLHCAGAYRLRDMYPNWYEGPGPGS